MRTNNGNEESWNVESGRAKVEPSQWEAERESRNPICGISIESCEAVHSAAEFAVRNAESAGCGADFLIPQRAEEVLTHRDLNQRTGKQVEITD